MEITPATHQNLHHKRLLHVPSDWSLKRTIAKDSFTRAFLTVGVLSALGRGIVTASSSSLYRRILPEADSFLEQKPDRAFVASRSCMGDRRISVVVFRLDVGTLLK